jgi:hypothetical protein
VEDIHEQDIEAQEKAAGHGDAATPGAPTDGDDREPRGH